MHQESAFLETQSKVFLLTAHQTDSRAPQSLAGCPRRHRGGNSEKARKKVSGEKSYSDLGDETVRW